MEPDFPAVSERSNWVSPSPSPTASLEGAVMMLEASQFTARMSSSAPGSLKGHFLATGHEPEANCVLEKLLE